VEARKRGALLRAAAARSRAAKNRGDAARPHSRNRESELPVIYGAGLLVRRTVRSYLAGRRRGVRRILVDRRV